MARGLVHYSKEGLLCFNADFDVGHHVLYCIYTTPMQRFDVALRCDVLDIHKMCVRRAQPETAQKEV
jgi:hypothetical protein